MSTLYGGGGGAKRGARVRPAVAAPRKQTGKFASGRTHPGSRPVNSRAAERTPEADLQIRERPWGRGRGPSRKAFTFTAFIARAAPPRAGWPGAGRRRAQRGRPASEPADHVTSLDQRARRCLPWREQPRAAQPVANEAQPHCGAAPDPGCWRARREARDALKQVRAPGATRQEQQPRALNEAAHLPPRPRSGPRHFGHAPKCKLPLEPFECKLPRTVGVIDRVDCQVSNDR